MDSFELLTARQSNPNLIAPAPDSESINTILNAGMRVPDHGCLTPWHFKVITEQGLNKLSDLFVSTIDNNDQNQIKIDKLKRMPFRAPMMIIVSTRYQQHDKVPKQEQLITAGCCVHAMQMAAFSLGYGAMWRTGDLAYNNTVKTGLNINEGDDIVGFLYLGTVSKVLTVKDQKNTTDFVSYWS